jgi:hypothetical protein
MNNRSIDSWMLPFKGIELRDIDRLGSYVNLPSNVLLHAGAPYSNVNQVPKPVFNAACQVLLLDRRADTHEHALSLIESETVKLKPAQSYGVVTPLAQVVSNQTWVFQVSDGDSTAYAPLVEKSPPALRFGCPNTLTLEALRALDGLVPVLRKGLTKQRLLIATLISAGLHQGDECHAVTTATHKAMMAQIKDAPSVLNDQHGFVLPLVMAASAVALRRAGTIVAVGCNGVTIGWQPSAQRVWHQKKVVAPVGERLASHDIHAVLPAIGDSAVIDFAGLGAQALQWSPIMQNVWKDHIQEIRLASRFDVIDPRTGLVCINPVITNDAVVGVHLAMVDKTGSGHIMGRGAIGVDPTLFDLCANSTAWGMMPCP